MAELLDEAEVEAIVAEARRQKYRSTRKNVVPWCMQWMMLGFGGICLLLGVFFQHSSIAYFYFGFGAMCLLAALIGRAEWKRYQALYVLKRYLDGGGGGGSRQ